jgi:prepilin-type N-terminal cleavage/methylation domain-containing protein/prepilin-type processing-associated H-X9-DG protein
MRARVAPERTFPLSPALFPGYRGEGARAFSLIELIVVIGIIAILLALLMPTLTLVRDRAKQLKCAAQLHALGQGLANYAVAFKGAYPACAKWEVYGGDGTGGDDTDLPGWTEELERYYAKVSTGAYHCPAFEDPTVINYYIETHWLYLQGRLDLKTSDITASAQFILSGDCTHVECYLPPSGVNESHEFDDCDKDSARYKNLAFFGEEFGRNVHRGGNNVLFADYHVSAYRRFERSEMTFHPKRAGVDWDELIDERGTPQ